MHIIGKDSVPPVGTYNVDSAFRFAKDARADTLAKSAVQPSFLGKAQRFQAKKTFDLQQIKDVPGPGSYNPSTRKIEKKTSKPVIGKTLRFNDPGQFSAHLGPGAYVSMENSMMKKSFNITFSDKKTLPPPEAVQLAIGSSNSDGVLNRAH